MLSLQIKNKHIAFAIQTCFGELKNKLQYELQQMFLADGAREKVQTVNIDVEQLLTIYKAASVVPEGVAKATNEEMKSALLPQLMAAAELPNEGALLGAITEVKLGTLEPNEGLQAIMRIIEVDAANEENKENRILAGYEQILKG